MISEDPRPQFLTVLSILSIGLSVFSIILSLFGIPGLYLPTADNPQLESTFLKLQEDFPGMEQNLKNFLNELDAYKIPNWALTFTGNCFSLMGVLMMWNFRKRGLMVYAAAEIVPTLISLIFFIATDITDQLGSIGPAVKISTAAVLGVVLIFDGVFIFLFSRNRNMT